MAIRLLRCLVDSMNSNKFPLCDVCGITCEYSFMRCSGGHRDCDSFIVPLNYLDVLFLQFDRTYVYQILFCYKTIAKRFLIGCLSDIIMLC